MVGRLDSPLHGSSEYAPTGHSVGTSRLGVLTDWELAEEVASAWDRTQLAIKRGDKESLRAIHVRAKLNDPGVNVDSLLRDFRELSRYFPEPGSINPILIRPVLIEVGESRTLEGRLFRLLRAYWSMPFSKGYGRRLRFIVMDSHHEAVIGAIGLQSPSADLKCRDDYLGIGKSEKLTVVNRTLDAYTVGASPTYAPLLGGKLVAGLIHSEMIRQAYRRKYGNHSADPSSSLPDLLAVTTTSAFGRSSIYNRLKFQGRNLAKPLGFTKGFGTVHLEGVYPHIVAWLKDRGKHVPAGFGNGPKVRWQNVIHALDELGISRNYLSHGLEREVFIFEFADDIARAHSQCEQTLKPPFDDSAWADFWLDRWCLKRAATRPDWHMFSTSEKMEDALRQFL